jgi:hypothetical protein
MQKSSSTNDDAQYLLRKMLVLAGEEVSASHQWLSEIERWKELVFALLTQTTKLPQTTVRVLTDEMLQLDLLDIPLLAKLVKGKTPALDLKNKYTRRIIQLLQEGGFSHDEAVKGLTVVSEVAIGLDKQFSGKIQFYLRSYAEQIVKDAQTMFQFSKMDKHGVRYAFTYWIQNVLNMPLSLDDKSVESFSKAYGLTSKQFFDAADEMDVNVALVDDLVLHLLAKADDEQNPSGYAIPEIK